MTLLPPSLTDYTNHSQTLPIRGKFSKRPSSSLKPLTSTSEPPELPDGDGDGNSSPAKQGRGDQSPPNTRYTPQALMNHVNPQVTHPPSSLSPHVTGDFSVPEMERGKLEQTWDTDSQAGKGNDLDSPNSASKQSTVKCNGKTPGEIVMGAMKNKRPSGGLKKAINMYQESRKQSVNTHNISGEGKGGSGEFDDRLHSIESEVMERTSHSESELVRGGGGAFNEMFFLLLRSCIHPL